MPKLIEIIDYWVFSCEGPYMYKLLIKLVKCSLMTQEQHSNIHTLFLGDVLLGPLSYYCVSTHVSTA